MTPRISFACLIASLMTITTSLFNPAQADWKQLLDRLLSSPAPVGAQE